MVICLVVLVRHENSVPSPVLPIALLRKATIWRADALAACHGAIIVSLITFLPIYLEVVRGHSPSETGLLLVPLTVGVGAGSLTTGRLVSKTGLTTFFPTLGLSLLSVSIVVLSFWIGTLGTHSLAITLLWIGLLMGTVMGVVQVTVQTASGPQRLGQAAASVQFSRSIGAALGTALVSTVLFAALSIKHPEIARTFAVLMHASGPDTASLSAARQAAQAEIAQAFRLAFWSIAGFAGLGAGLAFSIPLRRI